MESPSARIVAAANATWEVADAAGRRIVLRRPGVVEQLRLFKAVGPVLAENAPWFGIALLAAAVVEIDGVPVPFPSGEAMVEAIVGRLGDAGVRAVAEALHARAAEAEEAAPGN